MIDKTFTNEAIKVGFPIIIVTAGNSRVPMLFASLTTYASYLCDTQIAVLVNHSETECQKHFIDLLDIARGVLAINRNTLVVRYYGDTLSVAQMKADYYRLCSKQGFDFILARDDDVIMPGYAMNALLHTTDNIEADIYLGGIVDASNVEGLPDICQEVLEQICFGTTCADDQVQRQFWQETPNKYSVHKGKFCISNAVIRLESLQISGVFGLWDKYPRNVKNHAIAAGTMLRGRQSHTVFVFGCNQYHIGLLQSPKREQWHPPVKAIF